MDKDMSFQEIGYETIRELLKNEEKRGRLGDIFSVGDVQIIS